MVGAVGERYRTIAFGTLVVAIYTTPTLYPDNPASWFINPVLILLGHFALQYWDHHRLPFPNRPKGQESVAKAFCALGNYLDAKSEFLIPDEIDEIEKKHLNFAMKTPMWWMPLTSKNGSFLSHSWATSPCSHTTYDSLLFCGARHS